MKLIWSLYIHPLCVMPFHCNNFMRFGKIVYFAFFVLHLFQVVVLPLFITFEPLDGFFNFKKVNDLKFQALFNETYFMSLNSSIFDLGAMNFYDLFRTKYCSTYFRSDCSPGCFPSLMSIFLTTGWIFKCQKSKSIRIQRALH